MTLAVCVQQVMCMLVLARFSVTYILSEPDDDWTGPTGRVNKDLLKAHVPALNDGVQPLVCACGPIPFTKEVIR